MIEEQTSLINSQNRQLFYEIGKLAGRMNNKAPTIRRDEVESNLCCYDTRSPDYNDLLWGVNGDPKELPRPRRRDCGCDNCFYGRDRLAVALLDLLT